MDMDLAERGGVDWCSKNYPVKGSSSKAFKKGLEDYYDNQSELIYLTLGSKLGNKLHTRIRLNSSDLNEHLVRLGKADSPRCACGATKENTD